MSDQDGGSGDRRKIDLGPTGRLVSANIRALRTSSNLTYAALSRRLSDLGRPIAVLGLTRIENGERRVDADDLVALAFALSVNPNALLLPAAPTSDEVVEITGCAPLPAGQVWSWADGVRPLDATGRGPDVEFGHRTRPEWAQIVYGETLTELSTLHGAMNEARAALSEQKGALNRAREALEAQTDAYRQESARAVTVMETLAKVIDPSNRTVLDLISEVITPIEPSDAGADGDD